MKVYFLPVRTAILVGILLTILTCVCHVCCDHRQLRPCVWRITPLQSDAEAGFIRTSVPFQVSYLDTACTQELQWQVTEICTVQNSSSLQTVITCQYPGRHTILPVVHQSCSQCVPVGKTVLVRNSSLCYRWYAVSIHNSSIWSAPDTNPGQWTAETLRVWVVDWAEADDDERNHIATSPSYFSAGLTRMFHRKNQRPTVTQVHASSQQQLRTDNITFKQNLSYWEVFVSVPFYLEAELKIKGRPDRAVNMCFIGDTTVLLTNRWLSSATQDETTQLRHASGHPTRLVQDPCASHVAVLLSENSVLLTQDGFLTSKNLTLPSHLVKNLNLDVESVAFTPTHLILLMDSKVWGLPRTMVNLTQVTGLTGQAAMKGQDWCIPSTLHKSHQAVSFNASSLFLISTVSLSDHRLISQEIPLPLSVLRMLGFTAEVELEIQDVAFESFSNLLELVVTVTQNSHSSVVFLQYNITLASWTHERFWLDVRDTRGTVSLKFSSGAHLHSFLFWDQKRLFFSYQNGQYGTFSVRGSDSAVSNVSSNEMIEQVSISQSGDILVLLSSNCLYYSQIGQTTLVSLSASELVSSHAYLLFDLLGNVFVVGLESNGSSLQHWRWQYPLKVEVAGALHDAGISCPYRRFEHTDVAGIYYLDIGNVIQLWTCLTFPSDADIKLQVVSSSPGLLHITEEDLWAYHPGRLAINKTLTIQPSLNLETRLANDVIGWTGDIKLEVRPDQEDLGCEKPTSMVAHFSVGCPPGRHIRVRKPDRCSHFSNYTIPRDAYLEENGSNPEDIKIVKYDWAMFACPITAHYQLPFRPSLDLYDHDEIVTEVDANYVVTEEQGRVDFSYNTSMLQAGCHTLAPTPLTNNSDEIVASERYQHCFILNGTKDLAALKRQNYHVLNQTGLASLTWTTGINNSIYQFTATVVDPRYSFCRLQAKFAVLVYGHPPEVQPKPVTQVSLGTFAVLTFALGVISYMYYRKGHIKKLEEQLFDYNTD
ncbi:cation channel sperm-associated protein subunit epsilon-like [Acanthaster planci]|uniref:Cation channel sperm-associated protein subunit epsilon-like n=1 Tax=Acanthaster planci TaxID=133434 RepID=A0A8B7XND6_ACAPL|nr:cation channel sperm-associated protein subunit epsilon-like [Acanthaster planci]